MCWIVTRSQELGVHCWCMVMVLVGLVCPAIAAVQQVEIEPPIEIVVDLDGDVPAYDLCWSAHTDQVRGSIADRIVEPMADPSRLYVIRLPDYPASWPRVRAKTPRDIHGAAIPSRALRNVRRHYVRDVTAALEGVLREVRDRRPGVTLHVETWGSVAGGFDFALASTESAGSKKKKGKKSKKKKKGKKKAAEPAPWMVRRDGAQWVLEAASIPDDLLSPPQSRVDAWASARAVSIELPSRKESPFGSQHGPQTAETLQVFPAEYTRRSEPVVGIMLSFRGTADANPDSNPRGWRRRYTELPKQGWTALDPYMEQLEELGFREVWFWGWSGQHPDVGGLSREVMPWFGDDGHTPIMRATWPDFVARWKRRGFTFGYWLGGVAIPNFGTTERPEHRYITRRDFQYVADTLARMRRLGFEAVGLDAFKWILVQRDMPWWANWRTNHAGPRDPGIAMALLDHLKRDRRLSGMYICTENRAPYGEVLAARPTFQLLSSTSRPRGKRPTVETLQPPEIENVVNPGHEIIMMLSTDGWTLEEYDAAMARINAYGYRPAVAIEVLFQTGLMHKPE